MRIQHNIMAMSAYRNYTNNVSAMKKNLEKLSSGYKINRAGDDAAGLAISEKMRAQITGLETAQKNAKDGISLVQTAEGALTEVHDMLNRMVELATMSANGTYDDDTDRAQLQKEMDQLRDEIDRIADSANFNGINLLDGSLQGDVTLTKVSEDAIEGLIPDAGPKQTEEDIVNAGTDIKNTIFEGKADDAKKASFDISLDGLDTITATAGDVFNLKVGNDTISVSLTAGTDYDAKALATALKGANATVTIGDNLYKVTDDGKGKLSFETDAEGVKLNTAASVTWELKNGTAVSYADDGIASLDDDGIVVYAAGDATIDPVGTGATVSVGSASASINTKTGIGWGSGAAAALASAAGVTAGAITLKYDATSGWVLKTGTGSALTATAASATLGTNKDALTVDFGNGVQVTLTATGLAAASGSTPAEVLAASDFQTAFGTAQTIGTLGVEEAPPTPSGDTPSATNVTANIPAGSVSGMTTDYSNATSATVIATGDAAKLNAYFQTGAGSSITVDGKTVKLDNVQLADGEKITEKLAQQIGAAVKAELAKDTEYTYSDIKVKVGNADPIAIQANGDTPPIQITFTKTPKDGGGDNTGAVKAHGVINRGIQNPVDASGLVNANKANTVVDFGSVGGLADGSEITIGDTTYTIALGKDSKFKDAANVAHVDEDLTGVAADVIKQKAAQALARAAKDNATFSVGHDGKGHTTLQQKDVTATEMTTKEEIASYLGVKAASGGNANAKALTLQIGDTAEDYNQLKVSIRDMHADALGIGKANIKISDQDSAAKAIDAIKEAINAVSDVRGTLGATQNRLDHTINNLSVMTENIQDAESTIRDVDVAEEMMAYTKNNILIQSAQAMLAQANQVPQGVLQLLQ